MQGFPHIMQQGRPQEVLILLPLVNQRLKHPYTVRLIRVTHPEKERGHRRIEDLINESSMFSLSFGCEQVQELTRSIRHSHVLKDEQSKEALRGFHYKEIEDIKITEAPKDD
jgi:hypothetical protein